MRCQVSGAPHMVASQTQTKRRCSSLLVVAAAVKIQSSRCTIQFCSVYIRVYIYIYVCVHLTVHCVFLSKVAGPRGALTNQGVQSKLISPCPGLVLRHSDSMAWPSAKGKSKAARTCSWSQQVFSEACLGDHLEGTSCRSVQVEILLSYSK